MMISNNLTTTINTSDYYHHYGINTELESLNYVMETSKTLLEDNRIVMRYDPVQDECIEEEEFKCIYYTGHIHPNLRVKSYRVKKVSLKIIKDYNRRM